MNDEAILELARAVRPDLEVLVASPSAAKAIDAELVELLDRAAAGENVEERILEQLSASANLEDWAAAFLERGRPPDVLSVGERGSAGLPGELPGGGEPVRASRYACPRNDYVFYRRAVGQTIPQCPTHGVALEPYPVSAT